MNTLEELVLHVLQNAGDFLSAQEVWRSVWTQMDRHEKAGYRMEAREPMQGVFDTARVFHKLHHDGVVELQNRINMISVEAKYLNPLERLAAIS